MIYLFSEITPLVDSAHEKMIMRYLESLPPQFVPVRKRMLKWSGDIIDFFFRYKPPIKVLKSESGPLMIRRLKKSEIPKSDRVRAFVKYNGPVLESVVANKLKIHQSEIHGVVAEVWRQGFVEYSYGKNGGLTLTYKNHT